MIHFLRALVINQLKKNPDTKHWKVHIKEIVDCYEDYVLEVHGEGPTGVTKWEEFQSLLKSWEARDSKYCVYF